MDSLLDNSIRHISVIPEFGRITTPPQFGAELNSVARVLLTPSRVPV